MADLLGDVGDFPEGFVDPVTNPALPWITAYDLSAEDPVPPAERLAAEPVDVATSFTRRLANSRFTPRKLSACAIPGINLSDYRLTPAGKGWGAPCNVTLARVQLTVAAVSVDVRIAELVGLIMRANERDGYRYRQPDTGAYNCRKIGNSGVYSNHAWGLAIDENWQSNPMTWPLRTDRPAWERARWNRYGFAWGGDYTPDTPPDAMHNEFMGTPAQAQAALELARRELGGGAPVPVPAPAPAGPAVDEQLKRDQLNLNDTGFNCGVPDGINGPATKAAASAFQRAAGLAVDGDIGPATRAALAKVPSWRGDFVGDGGYSALRWQTKLQEHGWHIETDNAWGPHSSSILRQYQAEKHLSRVDGVRNAEAWTSLFCTVR